MDGGWPGSNPVVGWRVRELVGMSPVINNIPAMGKGPRRLWGCWPAWCLRAQDVGPRPRRGNHSPTLAPAMGVCADSGARRGLVPRNLVRRAARSVRITM